MPSNPTITFTYNPPNDPQADLELTAEYTYYRGSSDREDPPEICILDVRDSEGNQFIDPGVEPVAEEAILQQISFGGSDDY